MKKIFVLLGALLLLPAVMFAADFRTESVGANENVKNLYVGGQSVVVDANVKSDLVAAGGNVQVNGAVEHSLLAAGGTVRVKGSVGQNVRVAGGNVFLDGTVNEDVSVAGGTVNLSSTSAVNGDVMVAGGNVDIDGQVKGTVYVSGGQVTIRGNVGNVIAKNVGMLKVVNGAVINGKLTYSSPNEATIESGAKVAGPISFTRLENQNFGKNAAKALLGWTIVKALMILITLLVLVYLFPRASHALTRNAFEHPWVNLLVGFVSIIVIPIVLFVLLLTVLGLQLALLAGLAFAFLLALATPFAVLVIGSETWKLFNRGVEYVVDWRTILLGVVIAFVLGFIPLIGWLVFAVFYLIAFGSFLSLMWEQTRMQFATVTPPKKK